MPDPAQDAEDDKHDDEDRGEEADRDGAVVEHARVDQDDRRQRVDEGAEEGGQHGLGRGVGQQQAMGPRRHLVRGGAMRGHHHAEREGGDGQHRGGEDVQDRPHAVRTDPAGQLEGHEALQDRRHPGGGERQHGHQRHPHPDPARELDHRPEQPRGRGEKLRHGSGLRQRAARRKGPPGARARLDTPGKLRHIPRLLGS